MRRKARTRKEAILAKREQVTRTRERQDRQFVIEEALNDIQTAMRAGDPETAEMYAGHASDVLERSGEQDLAALGRKADAAYKLFRQCDQLLGKAYDILEQVQTGVKNAGRG